ncbi:MAG: type II toxin-antitoxin system VapC family toxin [Acidimicrobiales bacterium]
MIVYFDTSALIPLLVEEAGSLVAGRLWDQADRVVSSRLAYAEARAALAQARRADRIDAAELRRAVADLDVLVGDLNLVELGETVVYRAGELAELLALRGYDAVHLSSAESLADPDLVLAAGDRELLRAAGQLQIATAGLRAPD